MMQKELKERKQCSYKPSSVPIPSETIRAPVIYLVPESPLGSSTLPSAAARRQSDEWSLTPPSHPYPTLNHDALPEPDFATE